MSLKQSFHTKLLDLKDGSSDVFYHGNRYLLSKKTELSGKLVKLYAKELGNNDFISLNYYSEIGDGLLKPCEMPQEKGIDFVLNLELS